MGSRATVRSLLTRGYEMPSYRRAVSDAPLLVGEAAARPARRALRALWTTPALLRREAQKLRARLTCGLGNRTGGLLVGAVLWLPLHRCTPVLDRERPSLTDGSVTRMGTRAPNPIRVEALDPQASPPTFVMRGEPRGPELLVFLHGMCGHGLGYAQSFQFSAARHGTLIAPQADVSCGGPFSKWSAEVAKLDARIVAAFQALGIEGEREITVIGMSQGATRAAALAERYPERYTRLISMAAPTVVRPAALRHLRSAVMMAGERDRRDLMRQSERVLSAVGVPATFMLIPEAMHGAMGPSPERTMGQALDWLFQHSKPAVANPP